MTREEIIDVVGVLMEEKVPYLSPSIGIFLVLVKDRLEGIPPEKMTPDIKAYKEALNLVIQVAVVHQSFVISKFEELINQESKGV